MLVFCFDDFSRAVTSNTPNSHIDIMLAAYCFRWLEVCTRSPAGYPRRLVLMT